MCLPYKLESKVVDHSSYGPTPENSPLTQDEATWGKTTRDMIRIE